ncbi:MAG: amidohydrolase family protein [Bryobacteraceae bacterium]
MIDVNAYLKHFAFRRLRHNTAPALLKLMDRAGIERAAVSSASAIAYRNPQAGNEELVGQIGGRRDRLTPLAVLNPAYAGWEDDLKICHEQFGMKGLRLYPRWHNYKLSDAACMELVHAASERKMLITIPVRVEDPRQRTWLVDIPDVPLAEIAGLVKAFPNARFVIMNGVGFARSPFGRKDSGLPANYWIEICRLTAVIANELGQLVSSLGADRIVLGTGMPFHYPDPALLKVEVLDAAPADKEKIRRRNVAALLDW